MGLFGGLLDVTTGLIKTSVGVVADVATLGSKALDGEESYTEKGLKSIGKGLDKTFED